MSNFVHGQAEAFLIYPAKLTGHFCHPGSEFFERQRPYAIAGERERVFVCAWSLRDLS